MNNRIEIPLNKKNIALLVLAGIIFVIGGIWIATNPERFIPNIFRVNSPEVIRIVGIVGVLFFGVAGFNGIKKLFDKKVGLIIDSNGITDNSNSSSVGLIEWDDITEIRTKQVMSTKFLLINIVNPEKYIGKAKSRMQAKIMQANMNMYETPLSITSSTLKYDFGKLEKLIKMEFKRNKNAR